MARFHLIGALLTLLTLAPRLAHAYELELTLTPDELPRPVLVPAGVDTAAIRVAVTDVELQAGEHPAPRTFDAGGVLVEVTPPTATQPYRAQVVALHGRQVLMLNAERFVAEGRVEAVTVRISVPSASGGPWPAPTPAGWNDSLPSPPPVMAIVITRTLRARSRSLDRFIQWREAGGFEVIVGTEDDWDIPGAPEPDGRAERIRAWLGQLHDERDLGYVLLIGDPSPATEAGVPMKMTHPLASLIRLYPPELEDHIDPVPTDHYYADLEGNWDLDGDGQFLEVPQDMGPGSVRWVSDVVVGRIPVYWDDGDRLDEILETIVDYETEPDPSYRHRIVLPAAFLGFEGSLSPTGHLYTETVDGALPVQAIATAIADLDPEAQAVRLFEEQGVITSAHPHELALTERGLGDAWRGGAGLVVMVGHGSPEGIYRTIWLDDWNDDEVPNEEEVMSEPFLSSWNLRGIAGSPPAFSVHSTCENGWPEFWENLASSVLASGAVASLAASRIAIGGDGGSAIDETFEPAPEYGDADTLAYAFAHLLYEGMSAGEAVAYLRYGLPADAWGYEGGYPLSGYGWLGKLEFNLYGDPTVGLGLCTVDDDCQSTSACRSAGRCVDGFCVTGELTVDCSSLDAACVEGQCNPITGDCEAVARPEGTSCDDGLYCTVNERCLDSACVGDARPCGWGCSETDRRCLDGPEPEPEPDASPDGSPSEIFDDAGCSCRAGGRPRGAAIPLSWLAP